MTSQKQIAANQANSKKSTGAKTEAGKEKIAVNAVKHGILSQRLLLPSEDQQDFTQLQEDLRLSLRPAGPLELILVEKIAVVLWKQKRLVEANTASIELATGPQNNQIKRIVCKALECTSLSSDDMTPLVKDDYDQMEWCRGVLKEHEGLPAGVLAQKDLAAIEKHAPQIYEQFCKDAEDEEYIEELPNGIITWCNELASWCRGELKKYEMREKIPAILQLAQRKESAHLGIELINRYQAASDNELYRALEALRKQQEWRQKNGHDIEVEAVAV